MTPLHQVGGASDAWTQGHGCIQVCAAYEYLKQHWQFLDEHVPIIVKCGEGQGVVIREQSDLSPCIVRDVNVRAFFPPDSPPDSTCKFSLNLNLTSTASWLTAPSHLALMSPPPNAPQTMSQHPSHHTTHHITPPITSHHPSHHATSLSHQVQRQGLQN